MESEEEVEPIHKEPQNAPKPTHQEQVATLKLDDDDVLKMKNCVVTEEEADRVKEQVHAVNTKTLSFLEKTFEMVEDPRTNPIVSWSATHDSLIVWDSQEICKHLLPKYFNHTKFTNFVRQLYHYGFRKVNPVHWEFRHESFLEGKKHLLKNIKRSKCNKRKKNEELVGVDMIKRPKILGTQFPVSFPNMDTTTPNVEHRHQGSELHVMFEKLMAESYVVDEEVNVNEYSNTYLEYEDLIRN